jgi:1-acyl-sn-glycerol-3-phosphate acyltransferase
MLDVLAGGRRLVIFPEGTTTAGTEVLPFHGALFQSAIDAAVPVHALAIRYFDSRGGFSAAPAYIGDLSIADCLLNILASGGLRARLRLAESSPPPLPDRRHLAHRAHQAIAALLREDPQP